MALFSNNRKERENKIKDELNVFLGKHGAKMINFKYYYKIFGNIVLDVEFRNIMHRFVTDRGEIYHNEKFVCDNSYHVAGKNDTFEMLIKVIDKNLFSE